MPADISPEAVCTYCPRTAGYVARCGEATVPVCKLHVGEVCARWLYDMGQGSVEVCCPTPAEQVAADIRRENTRE